jgi:hypothetical protein
MITVGIDKRTLLQILSFDFLLSTTTRTLINSTVTKRLVVKSLNLSRKVILLNSKGKKKPAI